jgi:endoglucanase
MSRTEHRAAPDAPACDARATVAAMRLGWNLGNSLDVADPSKSDATVETGWGNPVVTAELMHAVAAAGFGAIRIPVTWIGRFDPAPSYRIRKEFMTRVEEVVSLALDQKLYVIINVHHDGAEGVKGQWLSLVDAAGKVTPEHSSATREQFRAIWVQIADRFRDYGDHLLFESMNELKVGYGPPQPAYLNEVNALNQAFVDTVRGSGSYNPQRCLVIPGYNTNIEHTLAGFKKPNDTSVGKLILSDHYYDPWNFAGEGASHAWGKGSPGADDWGQEDWALAQVSKLKSSFVDQGLPMIWGEYGAVHQEGAEKYQRYWLEVVTKTVHDAGITPFLWDNGSKGSGRDAFGLFDRSSNTVLHPEWLEALQRAVAKDYTLADVPKP